MGREKKCWPRSWPELTLGLRLFSPNVGKPPPTWNKRDKRMSKWVIRVFIFCLCLRLWKRNCLQFCCVNRTIQYNSRQWFTTWTHHSFDPSSARRVALLTRGLFLNSLSLSIHIHIFFVHICILVCPCFHCYVRMVFWLLFIYWVWLVWRFW